MRAGWVWLVACGAACGTDGPSDVATETNTGSADPFVGCLLDLVETDDGADGSVELSVTFTYDDRGRVLRGVVHQVGVTPDEVTTWGWDGDDEIWMEDDATGDAEPEIRVDRTFDGAHQALTERLRRFDPDTRATVYDRGCDNTWADGNRTRVVCTGDDPAIATYTWDGDLLLEWTYDVGSDGVVETTVVTTYDDLGREVLVQRFDAAGTLASRAETVYAPDGSSAVQTFGIPPDVDEIRSFTFDPAGRVLTHDQDYGGDGTVDVSMAYAYDDQGRETLSTWLDVYSGAFEEYRTTYDERGNVVLNERESDDDPDPESRTTSTWTCTDT